MAGCHECVCELAKPGIVVVVIAFQKQQFVVVADDAAETLMRPGIDVDVK